MHGNNSENGKGARTYDKNSTGTLQQDRRCAGETRRDPLHGAKDDAGTAKAADRGIGKAGAKPLLMGRFCYFPGV